MHAACKPAYTRREISQEGARLVADKVTGKILGPMAERGKAAPPEGFLAGAEGRARQAVDGMVAYYLRRAAKEQREQEQQQQRRGQRQQQQQG